MRALFKSDNEQPVSLPVCETQTTKIGRKSNDEAEKCGLMVDVYLTVSLVTVSPRTCVWMSVCASVCMCVRAGVHVHIIIGELHTRQ